MYVDVSDEDDIVADVVAEEEEDGLLIFVPELSELPPPSGSDRASFAKCGLPSCYKLVATIGRGAFGHVFAAEVRGRLVAVKAIQNRSHIFENIIGNQVPVTQRLFRELFLAQRLWHPNIVAFEGAAKLRCVVELVVLLWATNIPTKVLALLPPCDA